jgi:hypothetical protein
MITKAIFVDSWVLIYAMLSFCSPNVGDVAESFTLVAKDLAGLLSGEAFMRPVRATLELWLAGECALDETFTRCRRSGWGIHDVVRKCTPSTVTNVSISGAMVDQICRCSKLGSGSDPKTMLSSIVMNRRLIKVEMTNMIERVRLRLIRIWKDLPCRNSTLISEWTCFVRGTMNNVSMAIDNTKSKLATTAIAQVESVYWMHVPVSGKTRDLQYAKNIHQTNRGMPTVDASTMSQRTILNIVPFNPKAKWTIFARSNKKRYKNCFMITYTKGNIGAINVWHPKGFESQSPHHMSVQTIVVHRPKTVTSNNQILGRSVGFHEYAFRPSPKNRRLVISKTRINTIPVKKIVTKVRPAMTAASTS